MAHLRLSFTSLWMVGLVCLSIFSPALSQSQESVSKPMFKRERALSDEAAEKLITIWKENIRRDPENGISHFMLGSAYWDLGRFEMAVAEYKESIRLSPNLADAHYGLGSAYSFLNRFEEAVQPLKEAIRLRPSFGEANRGLGWAYGKLDRSQEAVEAFKEAVRINHEDAEAHLGLGLAFIQIGNREAYLKEYEILKKLAPDRAKDLITVTTEFEKLRTKSSSTSEKKSSPSFWSFFIGLFVISLIVPWIFSFLFLPTLGMLLLMIGAQEGLKGEGTHKLVSLVSYPIMGAIFLLNMFILAGWSSYVATRALMYSSVPGVTNKWTYYVVGFILCHGP